MDDLSPKQLEELGAKLRQQRDELQKLLADSAQASQTVDLDQPIGRLSRMDALQQQSMAKANRQNHQIRLQQTVAALKRFSQEDYGYCLVCEEPIGFKRLNAKPETPRCLHCQAGTERR